MDLITIGLTLGGAVLGYLAKKYKLPLPNVTLPVLSPAPAPAPAPATPPDVPPPAPTPAPAPAGPCGLSPEVYAVALLLQQAWEKIRDRQHQANLEMLVAELKTIAPEKK